MPQHAVDPVFELIKQYHVYLKIVNQRATRHGDYFKTPEGKHKITVNASLNKYRFLMTLIHEMAHLVAFQKYGMQIKPHGIQWKQTFQLLMQPFLNVSIFPEKLLPYLLGHFKNPTASSDTDASLAMAFKWYDAQKTSKYFVNDLPLGSVFRIDNGKIFIKGALRVKLFLCQEQHSLKYYLFKPQTEVELLKLPENE